MSRSEQSGVDQRDAETVAALAEGNRAYEEKFGRVFLIRAAGRTAEEMLTALRERLGHTPEQEEPIVAQQLREIAVLRLEQSLSGEERERMSVSHVTTHILDTAAGKPAAGVAVELYARDGEAWSQIGSGTTDADGRVKDLGPERLESGSYRLQFATGAYFAGIGQETFFPEVSLTFTVNENEEHYHVPLLLSPFAFSTYRGS
jgi:hydroxyisourate hydrolase